MKRGFSIVELLVVVAVIGIISSASMSLLKANDCANDEYCGYKVVQPDNSVASKFDRNNDQVATDDSTYVNDYGHEIDPHSMIAEDACDGAPDEYKTQCENSLKLSEAIEKCQADAEARYGNNN